MVKNRNKKNKAKNGGGAAAMDTSEGVPTASATAEAAQRNFPFFFRRFQWIHGVSLFVF
jgi:hypothetical protein